MKKMKLTIITDSYWPQKGGVEMAAYMLASELKTDYDIQIITHGNSTFPSLFHQFAATENKFQIDPSGNQIKHMQSGYKAKLILLPLLLWQIPKLKNGSIFDLLYFFYSLAFKNMLQKQIKNSQIVHCISTGYLARCASEICSRKKIFIVHSPFIHFGKWGDSPLQISAYATSDALICPTESFKQKILLHSGYINKSKIAVIPPIVPDPVKTEGSDSRFPYKFILFLGRREKHKGLPLLVSAFKELQSDCRLLIAGPGTGINPDSKQIEVLGEVDENTKQKLLSECMFLCVPSTDETFGIVYVEAMSYGKPVVALDVSPVNEIIENGKTGILVPPHDFTSLTQALEKMVSDDSLRNDMGDAARLCFEKNFSKNYILQKYRTLYRAEEQRI